MLTVDTPRRLLVCQLRGYKMNILIWIVLIGAAAFVLLVALELILRAIHGLYDIISSIDK